MAANIDVDKVKKLLAANVPQVAVASALGCTEGYVSQIADEFKDEIAGMKVAKLEGASNRDATIEKLEDKILGKLEKAIDYMVRPQELLSAFKVVNGSVRRGAGLSDGAAGVNAGQHVTIVLPQQIALTYVQNQQGEIIEANGRSLATLPSNVLKQMAASKVVPNSAGVTQHVKQLNKAESREVERIPLPSAAAA